MVRFIKKNGHRIQLLPPPSPEDPVKCLDCGGAFDAGNKRRCRLTKCGHLSCLECLIANLGKSKGCRQCLSSSERPKRDRRPPKRFLDEEMEAVTRGMLKPGPRRPTALYFFWCSDRVIHSGSLRKNCGKVFHCPLCPFSCFTTTKMKNHLEKRHKGQKSEWQKYACAQCGLKPLYHCLKDFRAHQRLVHNTRPR